MLQADDTASSAGGGNTSKIWYVNR